MAEIQTVFIQKTNSLLDYGTLAAILLGPIFAVQVQKALERFQAKNQRRNELFRTLMSTRATAVSMDRVRALNLIDIEFAGDDKVDKKIVTQWKVCRDHLNNCPVNTDPNFSSNLKAWSDRLNDLNAKLLQEIGESLNYDFDEVDIKKGAYLPQVHATADQEGQQLREGLLDIVAGRKYFPVAIASVPKSDSGTETKTQKE